MRGSTAIQSVSVIAMIAGTALAGAPRAAKVAAMPQATSTVQPTVMTRFKYSSVAEARHDNYGARGVVHSVARDWNEELLHAIRNDFARPTVHARNLYHIGAAMWDAWSAYDTEPSDQVFHHEKLTAEDVQAAREEAISFAVYRIMKHRFLFSPGFLEINTSIDTLMDEKGYDRNFTSTVGDSPAALGNRIAATIIAMGLNDGSNESGFYANLFYQPVNAPLLPDFAGNPDISDPNRWQPLALQFFKDQNGNPIPTGYPAFLSPEWGDVTPFALNDEDSQVYTRDGHDWTVWSDPGAPPRIGESPESTARYKWGNELVMIWSGQLDPTDGVMIDASPANIGNAQLPEVAEEQDFYQVTAGGDWGVGHDINPTTGLPYEPQIVPRGDYGRILAEFWADGPDSETPPGHWFTILNYVTDHPLHENRFMGEGPIMDQLEYDVKSYLILGGGMHDIAVSSWSVKGYYDYIRPISAIRYMCDQGQCTDPLMPNFNEDGIDLIPGSIELVTAESIMPGERHEHLAGDGTENLGKIAIKAWRGPDYIADEETDVAGVGWILAENWWPYQRPSFVTPPFAGYVSGHSTYSRGAAEIMTLLTGDEYFPGGMGEFFCPQNEFLVF
ncbi:MAG: hypothetical protein KC996_00865, partial [Phycisphaerales bacterium]|nr:hypothetical protein [Phycisphaerales bacterium]